MKKLIGFLLVVSAILAIYFIDRPRNPAVVPAPVKDADGCLDGYFFYDGRCVLSSEMKCTPMCEMSEMCLKGLCKKRAGCVFDNPVCSNEEICIENSCVKRENYSVNENEINIGFCCLDHALGIGSFQAEYCDGDPANVEVSIVDTVGQCRKKTDALYYRYAKYYKTTKQFAIACTGECSIENDDLVEASFIGKKKTFETLAELTDNILPKNKVEIHIGRDYDCFSSGYGEHPTGMAGWRNKHNQEFSEDNIIDEKVSGFCQSTHFYYIRSQNMQGFKGYWNYNDFREIDKLAIHELIHLVFMSANYNDRSRPAPSYPIQESFCKALSMSAEHPANFMKGYMWQKFDINQPPKKDDRLRVDFFVYSLYKRFGFDLASAKRFLHDFVNDGQVYENGDCKAKVILDRILKTDTQASFDDVHVKTK